ncbi:hypothetical protein [Methylomonas sp. HYX-M1]|uniref:hypothetical protein n=1 Tax=Methylomonas sp. HYX-M1 TaxID=3139307 RepID=UPI00345B8EAE
MIKNKQAAGCGDTQAAQQTILKFKFIEKLAALKGHCFRWATWLSQIGGGLW